jgi:hypothetical protein
MIDFRRVNRTAIPALPAIVSRLLPGGKVHSREYVVRNPRRFDRRAGSFRINLTTGQWADFATNDRGGDPVSLVAYLEGVSQGEAARLLGWMLGFGTREVRRHG